MEKPVSVVELDRKEPCRKRRGLWERPPKIRVIDGDPIPPHQL